MNVMILLPLTFRGAFRWHIICKQIDIYQLFLNCYFLSVSTFQMSHYFQKGLKFLV